MRFAPKAPINGRQQSGFAPVRRFVPTSVGIPAVVARPDCASGMHLDVRAFGPPPLKQMTEDFLHAYKTTVDFWAEDLKMQPRHGRDEGVVGETARSRGRVTVSLLKHCLMGAQERSFRSPTHRTRESAVARHRSRLFGSKAVVMDLIGQLVRTPRPTTGSRTSRPCRTLPLSRWLTQR
jgi:hypothetical protein